jgi:nicotinate-nucleotide pyrophosphorylase (carboxylating)
MVNTTMLNKLIDNALIEDVGDGDHSTLCSIDKTAQGKAVLKIKQDCILAGMDIAKYIFSYKQPDSVFHALQQDGATTYKGEQAFTIDADVHTILTCERLVLNIMQRMSGIATLTNTYTKLLKGYHTKLLDTRKTTPNFRLLEKEAVRIGGGVNHRFGLYDMIMLKDNHIDYCGGIEKALQKAKTYVTNIKPGLKIEVETRSIEDVKKALFTKIPDRIMLDNFTPELVKEAVVIIDGQCETEASGGITLDTIQQYAAAGVDYISVGGLIHQAKSVDLSLKAVIQ